ncbi:unnamed protein product [Parascedosporium putredinis]|uniref:Uncharacterized protein n=1 Tax=Parascedosporium putredinis TaxID=1442378 RepID=A0A9P1M7W6_9PEZI|nr:unnamed protein product [Parascedosporium putredinis]CAI7988742.1 unnamed protein product [Parascedosporium putredinis]
MKLQEMIHQHKIFLECREAQGMIVDAQHSIRRAPGMCSTLADDINSLLVKAGQKFNLAVKSIVEDWSELALENDEMKKSLSNWSKDNEARDEELRITHRQNFDLKCRLHSYKERSDALIHEAQKLVSMFDKLDVFGKDEDTFSERMNIVQTLVEQIRNKESLFALLDTADADSLCDEPEEKEVPQGAGILKNGKGSASNKYEDAEPEGHRRRDEPFRESYSAPEGIAGRYRPAMADPRKSQSQYDLRQPDQSLLRVPEKRTVRIEDPKDAENDPSAGRGGGNSGKTPPWAPAEKQRTTSAPKVTERPRTMPHRPATAAFEPGRATPEMNQQWQQGQSPRNFYHGPYGNHQFTGPAVREPGFHFYPEHFSPYANMAGNYGYNAPPPRRPGNPHHGGPYHGGNQRHNRPQTPGARRHNQHHNAGYGAPHKGSRRKNNNNNNNNKNGKTPPLDPAPLQVVRDLYKGLIQMCRGWVNSHAANPDTNVVHMLRATPVWTPLLSAYPGLNDAQAAAYVEVHIKDPVYRLFLITRVMLEYFIKRAWKWESWRRFDAETDARLGKLQEELNRAGPQLGFQRQQLFEAFGDLVEGVAGHEGYAEYRDRGCDRIGRELSIVLEPLLNAGTLVGRAFEELRLVAERGWEVGREMALARAQFTYRYPNTGDRFTTNSMSNLYPNRYAEELQAEHWRVALVASPAITCVKDTGGSIAAHDLFLADVLCMQ